MKAEKNITYINEASVDCEFFIATSFMWNITKENAAIMFCADDDIISLIQWDNFEEFAAYWGTETGDWLGIEKCKIFESVTDGVNIYTRIK